MITLIPNTATLSFNKANIEIPLTGSLSENSPFAAAQFADALRKQGVKGNFAGGLFSPADLKDFKISLPSEPLPTQQQLDELQAFITEAETIANRAIESRLSQLSTAERNLEAFKRLDPHRAHSMTALHEDVLPPPDGTYVIIHFSVCDRAPDGDGTIFYPPYLVMRYFTDRPAEAYRVGTAGPLQIRDSTNNWPDGVPTFEGHEFLSKTKVEKKRHAYSDYEQLPLWKTIDEAVSELVRNNDLEETTTRQHIVGFLVKSIVKSNTGV